MSSFGKSCTKGASLFSSGSLGSKNVSCTRILKLRGSIYGVFIVPDGVPDGSKAASAR